MVESSGDSTQKMGLETNSGDVYPAWARTAYAEPLDYHLVRLGTNPIGSAAYLPLPLPPVYLPREAFA
jgi:hypothetical protein